MWGGKAITLGLVGAMSSQILGFWQTLTVVLVVSAIDLLFIKE